MRSPEARDGGPHMAALTPNDVWHMISKSTNLTAYWDWSHGCQNDWKGALRDLHLFAFWVLLLVAFNAPCGPQQDRTRWQALAESWCTMFAHFDCGSCPLYDEKVQSIIDDRGGWESLHLEPGESVERGLWRTSKDQPPFSTGMPKCNLNRFFSSTQRARQELERWHSGLPNYEYWAIEGSMLSKPPSTLELRPQAKDNDMGKDSTASARAAPSAELLPQRRLGGHHNARGPRPSALHEDHPRVRCGGGAVAPIAATRLEVSGGL